jgi:hypothetical protein
MKCGMVRSTYIIAALLFLALLGLSGEARAWSAAELIAAVKAAKPKGGLLVRVRMEQKKPDGKNLVLAQIKRRDTADGHTEQLFQVTFPKERKGEALLLRTKRGSGFTAQTFTPGHGFKKLGSADKRQPIFGTDMTLEDALADFLDWTKHEIIGKEKVHSGECSIIESLPPRAGTTPSKVKSWVDDKRYIAWRVQIFDGGEQPARIVETEDVVRAASGYWFPRTFTISTPAKGTSTTIAGSSSSEQEFTDADFSEAAIQSLAATPAK